jgi:hypothetical protein
VKKICILFLFLLFFEPFLLTVWNASWQQSQEESLLSSQQHPLPCKGNILVEHFPSILQAPAFGSIHINIKQGEISQQRKKQSD